jgi:hypothetical protein
MEADMSYSPRIPWYERRQWQPGCLISPAASAISTIHNTSTNKTISCGNIAAVQESDDLLRRLLARIKR